jgi:hypothetical protein
MIAVFLLNFECCIGDGSLAPRHLSLARPLFEMIAVSFLNLGTGDGALNPLIFLTNWIEAARISSGVAGGSKLKSVLIFLHMSDDLRGRKNSPQLRLDHTAAV